MIMDSSTSLESLKRSRSHPDDALGELASRGHPLEQSHTNRSLASTLARRFSRHGPNESDKATLDPQLDINLPYRTLSAYANLDEYRLEVPSGIIAGPVEPQPAADGTKEHYKLVAFTPDDPGNPKNWSKGYKWYCTMTVSFTCFSVAFASAVITADLHGPARDLHASNEVVLLTISLFVVGFGLGPMVFAPLSEIYGRRII
jgi:hypothetical protein